MTSNMTEPFIGTDEVLDMIPGMTRNHLAQLRHAGEGPAFYAPTRKVILYKKSDVLEWLESSRKTITAHKKYKSHER